MTTAPRTCIICGAYTTWCCSDCALDNRASVVVYVCGQGACRLKHERDWHPDRHIDDGARKLSQLSSDTRVQEIDSFLFNNFSPQRPVVVPPQLYEMLQRLGISRLDCVRRNDPLPLNPED